MLCPAPLLAFLGRVMRGKIDAVSSTLIRIPWMSYERGDRCCVQHAYSLFLEGFMRGDLDAVSSTLTRFSWTGYERGDRCCVQYPHSLFLGGL